MCSRLGPLAFAVTLASAGTVEAQPAGEFLTLDRADHESHAGLFVGLLHIEETGFGEGGLRVEAYGQHVARSGLGGYISVPVHRVMIDGEEDETSLGGIEVGGILARRLLLGQELAVRAGLVLPTAGDGLGDFAANLAGVFTRLTDVVQASPRTSTLRLSGSWLGSLPGLVYRVDAGFDTPLFSTSDEVDVEHDPILRLNGALGLGLGPGSLAFELVNLLFTSNDVEGLSFSDRSFTNAGVSLGVGLSRLRVQGGLFLSVDSVLEDDAEEGLLTIAASVSQSW